MERNVEIAVDRNGKKYVRINEIRFMGKRCIDWDDVKSYLRNYIGGLYKVSETMDIM